jgi:hypothetical protein
MRTKGDGFIALFIFINISRSFAEIAGEENIWPAVK